MSETKKPEWVPTEYSLPSCDRQGGRMTCDRCGFDGPGSEGCGTHMCVHPRSLEELSDRTEMLKANGFLAKDKLDLDAWSALAEAATPGPWEVDIGLGWCGIQTAAKQPPRLVSVLAQANARFCAAAREAVPALIARVRELEAELKARREADDRTYENHRAAVTQAQAVATAQWRRADEAEARVRELEKNIITTVELAARAEHRARAEEREACAKVCEELAEAGRDYHGDGFGVPADNCANAIRDRGKEGA